MNSEEQNQQTHDNNTNESDDLHQNAGQSHINQESALRGWPYADNNNSKPTKYRKHSFLKEIPILIVIAAVITIIVRTFFMQVFYIPSASMEQTLKINDRVLVNKIVYDFRDIKRGE